MQISFRPRNMYRPYFEAAARFLESRGVHCSIHNGRELSVSQLADLPGSLGVPLPQDLLLYLRELGDGFRIQWELPECGDLVSFGLSFLDDIKDERAWIHQQLIETRDSMVSGILKEAIRRQHWLPIMGIGEGGYEFCVDAATEPASVWYYESEWQSNPEQWHFCLAPSLRELVRMWSRYCFSDPLANGRPVGMTIVARELKGEFDWESFRFDPRFDRGTTDTE
jgi:hypothetical protein